MTENYSYEGNELHLFARADNWKSYFGQILKPYIRGDVLEVGSGLGTTTEYLISEAKSWRCLEPDAHLADQSRDSFKSKNLDVEVVNGTLGDIEEGKLFDCILYIDVMEHIENDGQEIRLAASHLKKDGILVVLAPAHPFLFTPFDKAIGHYRRYNKRRFVRISPMELRLLSALYLDSAGLLASLGNKLILRRSEPTEKQIQFWDKTLVPISEILDPLLAYRVGKTIIGIWKKET